jgi:hypothetical protein
MGQSKNKHVGTTCISWHSMNKAQFKQMSFTRSKDRITFGIIGISLSAHFGWKPSPRNPIPISSPTALTYKKIQICSTLITSACYGTKIYELSSDQDSKQDMKHFVDIPTRPWSAWYIRVPIWVSIFLQRQTNKLQQGAEVKGAFHHTIIVWACRNVN